jgi:hypothetical protein
MLGPDVLTESRAEVAESIPRTLPRRPGTWGEWYEACRGGEPAGCNFSLAGPLTEFVLLGNIALRRQRPIEYDPASMCIRGDDEADALLREPYHNGWSLEG